MFSLFSGRENPYKECRSCTLPYIDNVNGRNGLCDFCTDRTNKIAAHFGQKFVYGLAAAKHARRTL